MDRFSFLLLALQPSELRWKLSFAVYCSANVQQKTIGLTHSNRATLALFLGCQPSSKIPHRIKSTRARLSVLIRRSARKFRVARDWLRIAEQSSQTFRCPAPDDTMCKSDKDRGNAQSRAAWSRSVRPWASTELLAVRGKDPSESARTRPR